MNTVLLDILALPAAFVVGAIPFGVLVSRAFYHRDLRAQGSGNIGAANALRTLGRRGAASVLLLDACKGAFPVLVLTRFGAPPLLVAASAFAAVLGHCYSPFLGGKGGKGVATSFGAVWALAWPAGAAFTVLWLVVFGTTGFASLASIVASLLMPVALGLAAGVAGLAYGLASAALIVFAHRENLVRLRAGTENRFFQRGKSQTSRIT
jgi:glycerol-3-phosphate acyltransferase PlsY